MAQLFLLIKITQTQEQSEKKTQGHTKKKHRVELHLQIAMDESE